nr:chaperone protein DnaJ-like [Ipomoea batatas]
MMWDEWAEGIQEQKTEEEYEYDAQEQRQDREEGSSSSSSNLNFDFLSLVSQPKDYYRILEVDYDATEEVIRSNYIRLALKWHPDKLKGQDTATSRFQEINEAYQVLSDPLKRQEYDKTAVLRAYDYNIVEYLDRYKGLILTCNGLGMKHTICVNSVDTRTTEPVACCFFYQQPASGM